MIDDRQSAYLTRVLRLDPMNQSRQILAHRFVYLNPHAALEAEIVDDSGQSPREQTRLELATLRKEFWQLDSDSVAQRSTALAASPFTEVALPAQKLALVAQALPVVRTFIDDVDCHPAFGKMFQKILVAPTGEAAKLRLDHTRYMTQGSEHELHAAILAIKRAAWAVKYRYPAVYDLEQEWIDELLAFRPISPAEDESSNKLLGLGMLIIAGLSTVVCGGILELLW